MKYTLLLLSLTVTACAGSGSVASSDTEYIRNTSGQTVARITDSNIYLPNGQRIARIQNGNIYSTSGSTGVPAGQRIGSFGKK